MDPKAALETAFMTVETAKAASEAVSTTFHTMANTAHDAKEVIMHPVKAAKGEIEIV